MDNVDMMADQVADLMRRASGAEVAADRVALLAQALGLALDPLVRVKLLMLLADAAGRAAHDAADCALAGKGRPGGRPASWSQIGDAAGLTKDTAYRQFYGGEALTWPPAMRGVRQVTRRGDGGGS